MSNFAKWIYAVAVVLSLNLAQAQEDEFGLFEDEGAPEAAETAPLEDSAPGLEASPSEDPLSVIDEPQSEEIPAPPEGAVPEFTDLPDVPTTEKPPAEFQSPALDQSTLVTPPAPESEAPAEEAVAPALPVAEPEIPAVPVAEPEIPAVPVAEPLMPKQEEVAAKGSDDPDLKRERRFHEIYRKYNQSPTSSEAWGQARQAAPVGEYEVQQGDTLWSVSKTLFGDSEYWPKVWSYNVGEIQNPHEIKPKMIIQFTAGTVEAPPQLKVTSVKKGDRQTVVVKGPIEDEEPSASSQMKAPKVVSSQATPIPPSLPEYKSIYFAEDPEIKVDFKKFEFGYTQEYLTHFAQGSPLNGVGRIIETEMGTKTAAEGQYVFVELNPGVSVGKFVAQFLSQKLKVGSGKPAQFVNVIENQGLVEVIGTVDPKKNIYRAVVLSSLMPIEMGSQLLPSESIPKIETAPVATNGIGEYKIIGGQYSMESGLISDKYLVFIEGGLDRGIQEGMGFNVYSNQRLRNKNTKALAGDRSIGQARVVHVADKVATAYITKSQDAIVVGDYISNKSSILGLSSELDSKEQ